MSGTLFCSIVVIATVVLAAVGAGRAVPWVLAAFVVAVHVLGVGVDFSLG